MDEKTLVCVAITLALVEFVKRGIPRCGMEAQSWVVPWGTLALAFASTYLFSETAGGKEYIVTSILTGLSAMGLWSGSKAAMGK